MNWEILLLLPVLLFSIVVHEVAHAWVAKREGDDTADRLGRITLNPLPHLDPVGSILVPLMLALLPGGLIFGWAKPVPVNPNNFRDRTWGDIRVSMAGIVSNLILAAISTVLVVVFIRMEGWVGGPAFRILTRTAEYGIFINLILAVFNLIPIPPLDGSHVVAHMIPVRLRPAYQQFGRYGILAIMAALFLVPGSFDLILAPVFALMDLANAFIQLWI